MADPVPQIYHDLRQFLREQLPAAHKDDTLTDDRILGSGGIGLDSIQIVELLLAFEQRWGIPFPASLLETPPLTVGKILAHLVEAKSGSGPS